MPGSMARQNFKVLLQLARHLANHHSANLNKWRCLLGKMRDEIPDQVRRALNFDGDSCRRVADVSAEVSISGEPINVRPEPDPLYDPGYLDLLADLHDQQDADAVARDLSRLRSSQASHSAIP